MSRWRTRPFLIGPPGRRPRAIWSSTRSSTACKGTGAEPCIPATASFREGGLAHQRWRRRGSSSSAPIPGQSPPWATRSRSRGRRQGQGLDRARPSRHHRGRERRSKIAEPDRLSGNDQGLGRRRRQGHAHRAFRGRGGGRFCAARSKPKSSFGDDRVFIEKFIVDPRHIEIGARRPARRRPLSRRARMLDPAPQPEGRRGSAFAAARRRDAQADGRAGRRASEGGRLRLAPAPSSSSSGRTAASISSR